jgi:hypothetical protein
LTLKANYLRKCAEYLIMFHMSSLLRIEICAYLCA